MKKILSIIVLIFLAIAVAVTVYLVKQRQDLQNHAAPATNLSLQTDNSTPNVNQQFSVTVKIDTAENTVGAVEVHISYDSAKLQGISITKDASWAQELIAGTIGNGTASITVGSSPTTPLHGTGNVAVLVFKALATGSTQIAFTGNTQAQGSGEQGDVVVGKTPVTVIIAGTPAATATPTPTSIPNATATPTPTRSASATATPTPTSTVSSGSGTTTSPSSAFTVSSLSEGQTLGSTQPTFSGKAPASAKVVVTVYSSPQTITVYADANGNWSAKTPAPLEAGSHKLVAQSTNASGQTTTTTVNFNVGLPVTASPFATLGFLAIGFVFLGLGLLKLAF